MKEYEHYRTASLHISDASRHKQIIWNEIPISLKEICKNELEQEFVIQLLVTLMTALT